MRIAASVAALLTICSLATGVSPAAADPAPAPSTKEKPLSAAVTAQTGKFDCAAVKADPAKFRTSGETQAGCSVAKTSAAAAAVAPVSCQAQTTSTWHYGRASLCLAGYRRTLQTVDANGAVTGTATVEIATDMAFQTQRLTWTETWYLTLVAATGRLTTLNLAWSVACGTGCTTRSTPAGAQTVTVGATVTGTTTYTANPAGRSEWKQTYSLTATNPQGDTLPVQSYPAYYPFRCDRVIGPNPGCVVPAVTIALAMSKTNAERSVQAAWLLQRDFPDSWGSGTFLHRQADSVLAQANYDAICNDGTFVKSGTSDTCVLFPPASTYETARLLGLSPADCVDATARQSRGTGQWYLDYAAGTVDFSERCLRAHAPDTEAAEFQRQLNGFYSGSRILDNDAFGLYFAG